jgi:uridylate kinase
MKATRVGGIFTADPNKDANAVKIDELSHLRVIQDQLAVMDASAVSLCMENGLPIVVFDMTQAGNIRRAAFGERIGSIVRTVQA